MPADRVIAATFSTWRPVNSRKVLQLVFEVPIEKQGDVLTMLGAPDDKWCAIALLKEKPAEKEEKAPKAKRAFIDMSLPEQAGLLSQDSEFLNFLERDYYGEWRMFKGDGADCIRYLCKVESRADITPGGRSGHVWAGLVKEFAAWKTDQRYGDMKR